MPAITACLIVSVLRISIDTLSDGRCCPKASSSEFQVSEPFSRTTKGSRTMRDMAMRGVRASGCSGEATTT
ncbi:hypothetical protein D9M68_961620 [compost metagenome]